MPESEPFAATRAGCGGTARTGTTRACGGTVRWVGVVYYPYPKPELHRAFACDDHFLQLDVARPLDDTGRAHLEHRRERLRRVVEDHQPYEPEHPLAVHAEARRRLERARAEATRHPDWRIAPDPSDRP